MNDFRKMIDAIKKNEGDRTQLGLEKRIGQRDMQVRKMTRGERRKKGE